MPSVSYAQLMERQEIVREVTDDRDSWMRRALVAELEVQRLSAILARLRGTLDRILLIDL